MQDDGFLSMLFFCLHHLGDGLGSLFDCQVGGIDLMRLQLIIEGQTG